MVKFFKKLNMLLCLSAVLAGFIFCLCGFTAAVPKGVTINGESVGGMSVQAAVKTLRTKIEEELKEKTLKIIADEKEYSYTYPEISYKDNLRNVLKSAKRGGSYTAKITYYLCGLDEITAAICADESVEKVEPYAEFKSYGEPFVYRDGNDGRQVDFTRLKADIQTSLQGGFEPVTVKYLTVFRKKTVDSVKSDTKLLGRFTTSFDSSNINRSSNIRLAAAKLNGVVLGSGKTLSFNDTVGARLSERGFLPAKIIENGEYTDGVGGGVCQVSTTLYNAALLSGMTVTEYHPHSLSVGYVDPSRDAMVSGTSCDLKFSNPSGSPVYIRSRTQGGTVTFELYGKNDGAKYSIESVVTGSVPAEEEYCSDPGLVREGRDGLTSEGYLVINRAGFVKRVKLRSDKYLAQKRVTLLQPEIELTDNT
ncbi:MAG: VanW family protein [Clostridiales bacterium]|nr:VanW family protein [Clostridiales bacterium]